jgi:receptor expression-enhancing protein 5/6
MQGYNRPPYILASTSRRPPLRILFSQVQNYLSRHERAVTVQGGVTHLFLRIIADRLQQLETQTGYPKALFFVVLSTILTGVLTLIGGAKLLVDLVGFLYPAYMSFKSMDGGSIDDTQWLTYWVVFSFLNIFESLFAFVVNLIPFYFWIKIAMVIWMWHPNTHGAQTIYQQGLRPLLVPYMDAVGGKSNKKSE